MKQLTLLIAVGLFISQRLCPAAIIYDTGPFTADGGSMASDFSTATGWFGVIDPIQRADDFALQNDSQIMSLNWWGLYAFSYTPQGPDDFTVRIFENAGGSPSASPLFQFSLGDLGRTDTGVSSFGSEVYNYSAILSSPVVLQGGTTYWLSIVNNTAADRDDNWYWQRVTRFSGTVQERATDASPWQQGSGSGILAFNLEGAVVPEPASWVVLLYGGASLAFVMRNRKL